ncbi:hypothetical protein Dfri01_58910 [Dyadobacter frigoris]|uniref:beta-barrel fold lipoprotein n=1 Tax=Dyadobacter frigoris TaxID=2576211 RepID=UPI0024A059F5|nr:hypothetical protein [Dyadobacter frigoris]GLU56430.1 hypothetical protein Dfri01_58910 [Dyadobacter frigoris]
MKKFLMYAVASFVLLSCSNDKENVVPESGAQFKIEYTQSGGFDGYIKKVGFSEPLVFEGTETVAGLILDDTKLIDSKYVFVTKTNVDLLKVTFNTEPKPGKGDMAEFSINVYRNGKQIDNKSFKVAGGVMSHSWEYKSK